MPGTSPGMTSSIFSVRRIGRDATMSPLQRIDIISAFRLIAFIDAYEGTPRCPGFFSLFRSFCWRRRHQRSRAMMPVRGTFRVFAARR
jgi:hypothetical protein